MFTPDQYIATVITKSQEADIEAHVDNFLSRGQLRVSNTRAGWLATSIIAVHEKYLAAGWQVELHPARDVLFQFHAPDTAKDTAKELTVHP